MWCVTLDCCYTAMNLTTYKWKLNGVTQSFPKLKYLQMTSDLRGPQVGKCVPKRMCLSQDERNGGKKMHFADASIIGDTLKWMLFRLSTEFTFINHLDTQSKAWAL